MPKIRRAQGKRAIQIVGVREQPKQCNDVGNAQNQKYDPCARSHRGNESMPNCFHQITRRKNAATSGRERSESIEREIFAGVAQWKAEPEYEGHHAAAFPLRWQIPELKPAL